MTAAVRMGYFTDGAASGLPGNALAYAGPGQFLVVSERDATPIAMERVLELLRSGVLLVPSESRAALAEALTASLPEAPPPSAAAPDGFLPIPEGVLDSDDPGQLMLLRTASNVSRGDVALAEGNPGAAWASYVLGAAAYAQGDPAATQLLAAAYAADPLNLKAANYLLRSRGREAQLPPRLPHLLLPTYVPGTPASEEMEEVLGLDLSEVPPVSSAWHLVRLVITGLTVLLFLAAVVLALLGTPRPL